MDLTLKEFIKNSIGTSIDQVNKEFSKGINSVPELLISKEYVCKILRILEEAANLEEVNDKCLDNIIRIIIGALKLLLVTYKNAIIAYDDVIDTVFSEEDDTL